MIPLLGLVTVSVCPLDVHKVTPALRDDEGNQEALLTDLSNFSIAGIMTAVVASIAWTLLERSLDTRESDLECHSDEVDRIEQEYLTNLVTQQNEFFSALDRIEQSWEQMAENIRERLNSLENRLPLHDPHHPKRQEAGHEDPDRG